MLIETRESAEASTAKEGSLVISCSISTGIYRFFAKKLLQWYCNGSGEIEKND
jgi:hypothetical protein